MLIDAEQLESESGIEAQVIIVGGGMAGILLARELGNSGIDVVILESGAQQPEPRVQALYQGKMTLTGPGNPIRELNAFPLASRARYFGGSGNVWGGKCAPLDPIDFEQRDWVAHSGWPMDRAALEPFYERACSFLDLPRFQVSAQAMLKVSEPLFGERSSKFVARPRAFSAYSGAVRDNRYADLKESLLAHPRVRVYLHANLTRINLSDDGEYVASLQVRTLNARKFLARAKTYVLATGGIENVRLLLASNDVHPNGIGNHSDWLGRAFQGHTVISQGARSSIALMRGNQELAIYNNNQRVTPHVVLGLSDTAQRRSKGVNFTMTMSGNATPEGPGLAVQALASGLAGAAVHASRRIYLMLEHTPNRESRVTLIPDDLDALHVPKVRIDMRYGATEFERFEWLVTALASELGLLAAGRLQWTIKREHLVQSMDEPSRHHMGATRMSPRARDGVVDQDCRVHGVRNLYIAGSSVFPTSGIANPTLTLLALAYRLSDHLRNLSGASP